MQTKTPMVLVLQDDEEIHGVIEWYDKYCLKVNRIGEPNLLIYKPSIKYMYKESEEDGQVAATLRNVLMIVENRAPGAVFVRWLRESSRDAD